MNKKLKEEEFTKLENRIWKTYQSRIIFASRLLNQSKLMDLRSAIYTICLTLLSVFTLINSDKMIGYFSAFVSIIVMGFVFYGNTMNYKDRYISMRDNYLKLGDLYYKCLNERIEGTYGINKICEEYSTLLKTVENHSTYDYITYLINDSKEAKKVTIKQKIYYITVKTFNFIFNFIIFTIPIILIVISWLKLI